MRSVGADPQPEIDTRTRRSLESFRCESERQDDDAVTYRALIVADDLRHASDALASELREVLASGHPRTLALADGLLALLGISTVSNPERSLEFARSAVDQIGLGGAWEEYPMLDQLRLQMAVGFPAAL